MTATAWQQARHVLCVRLDSLGDVLMSGPAMAALRDARADRSITLLTSTSGAAAGRLLDAVDDVIAWDVPWMKATPADASGGAHGRHLVDLLQGRGFDAACIFTVYSQSSHAAALTCQMAGVPLRAAHAREKPYGLLTDWVSETEPEHGIRHECQRQLDLVGRLGADRSARPIEVDVPDAARTAARAVVEQLELGAAGRRLVVVHPGASASSRRYPPARYAAAIDGIVANGHDVLLVGGDGAADRAAVASVQSSLAATVPTLTGALDVAQLAALLDHADLLVANNSGPAHLAAAVGTPIACLYALTNPQHAPWQVEARMLFHDVPCRWCHASACPRGHHACLDDVDPAAVVGAVEELLGRTAPVRGRGIAGART